MAFHGIIGYKSITLGKDDYMLLTDKIDKAFENKSEMKTKEFSEALGLGLRSHVRQGIERRLKALGRTDIVWDYDRWIKVS